MAEKKWQHDELAHDLAQSLRVNPEHIVWENMQMGPSGSIRPDVYLLKKRYSTFAPVTYEVKVSVSDFRSDITSGKWQGYLGFSSAVIFAVPAGLVSKDDVPAGCGLIVRHDEVWRTVKKPTMQKIDTLSHKEWMKLVIDGIERAVDQRDAPRLRAALSEWSAQEVLRRKVGEEIAMLIAKALRSKSSLEALIKSREEQVQEIRNGTQRDLKYAIERAARIGQELSAEQARLAAALGLDGEATADDLIDAMRKAARRLSGDKEVSNLRRIFENIKRYAEEGAEPLPGEQLRLQEAR
ncbi:MmcB family DNA repair protein [Pseudomonas citronellolis]|uniref:MmcB family DNA repair protein n=1 Tax=Pseudomonas citronellolis TaxID=53408 RepID=UPI00248EDD16|nr:MmcB family DNA repair protein [Pseudomonas citronellolis]